MSENEHPDGDQSSTQTASEKPEQEIDKLEIAHLLNLGDYEPYEAGEFVIEDITAPETHAPGFVPGIMNVVAMGFVYIPEDLNENSEFVTVKKFTLKDNLAGERTPIVDMKLDFRNGEYSASKPIRTPFRVEEDFEMTIKLEPDRRGVDKGFLIVIFLYDHEEAC